MNKILNKKGINIFFVILLISISCLSSLVGSKVLVYQNKMIVSLNVEKDIIVRYKENIPIVHIKAKSYYEYGLKKGVFLKKYYGKCIKFLYRVYQSFLTRLHVDAQRHIRILEKEYPSFLERIRGLSKAIGIPLLDIISFDLIFPGFFMGKEACTATVVSSNVTEDNQTFISWNVDLLYPYKVIVSRYFRPPPVIICNITGTYKYIEFGVIPFLFGFALLNENGLAYAGTQVSVTDIGEGLTSLELNHLAMERCATVDEVEYLYKNAERQSGMKKLDTVFGMTSNMNTLWMDAKGNALLIEYTHNYFASKRADVIAETNHHQLLDPNLTGSPKNDSYLGSTYLRLKRAYELLDQYNGSIDIDFYKKIFTSDHGKGFVENKPDLGDICRHTLNTPNFPWDFIKYAYGTACVVIIQPREYSAYYCPGHPCWVPFKLLDFKEEFR
jgi:predicted choloylglycine hydrolase